MKTNIIGLLLICALIGCSSNDNDVASIEFMSYNYSFYKENSNIETNLYIKCRIYSTIDESGKVKVYTKRTYPIHETLYYETFLDKNLIKEVIDASKRVETKTKKDTFNPDKVMIYDGPSLKIRINYRNDSTKSINFIDYDNDKNNFYFLKLYHSLDSTYLMKKFKLITDTLEFEKKRKEFVKLTFIDDTTNSPFKLPPPLAKPKDQIKYVIPKNR